MKILGIHIITDKELKRLIKEAKIVLYNKILNNPDPKRTILKKELGITDE